MCIEHHIVLNIVPCLCNEMCHCVTCVYGLCGFSYTSPFKASYTFVRTTLEKKKEKPKCAFFFLFSHQQLSEVAVSGTSAPEVKL